MKTRIAVLLLCCGLGASLCAQPEEYAIDWYSLDCGGGTSADEVYSISGTIGQFDAGEVGDAVYTVWGGFWQPFAEVVVEPIPLLTITAGTGHVLLAWPDWAADYYLEQTLDATQARGWAAVNQPVVASDGWNTVALPASASRGFFRLTRLPTPLQLFVTFAGSETIITWPAAATGYYLEQTLDLSGGSGWTLVELPVVVSNGLSTVRVPASGQMVYYRLTTQPGPPRLRITQADGHTVLSWPAVMPGYYLEETTDASHTGGWVQVQAAVVPVNGLNTVTLPVAPGQRFFRLTQTPTPLRLTVTYSANETIITWPAAATGFALEQTLDLTGAGGWSLVELPVETSNGLNTVRVPASGQMVFYRLSSNPSPPRLSITQTGNGVVLSWPAAAVGYYLEQTTDATHAGGWVQVFAPVIESNERNTVTWTLAPGQRFFRLTQTPTPLRLTVTYAANETIISWPAAATGFALEQTLDLTGAGGWSLVQLPVETGNGLNTVRVPASGQMVFYRLSSNPSSPRLRITQTGNSAVLFWPAVAVGYYLEQTADATQDGGWVQVMSPVTVSNGWNTVTLTLAPGQRFFRLTQTPTPLRLTIQFSENDMIIAWPTAATGYYLEQTLDLTGATGWSLVELPITASNGLNRVRVPVSGQIVYYRLTSSPTPPRLRITRVGGEARLSWVVSGYHLEQTTDATQAGGWLAVDAPVALSDGEYSVTLPLERGTRSFRLTRTPTPLRLAIAPKGDAVELSWPAVATGLVVQQNIGLAADGWSSLTNAPAIDGSRNQVILGVSRTNTFFRLGPAVTE